MVHSYPVRERDPRCPFDPAPGLAPLRGKAVNRVQIWNGREAWLLTGYDEIRQVVSHPTTSADTDDPAYPHQSEAIKARRARAKSFFTMDGEEHDRPRRALARDFTAKRMMAKRERIQAIVDELLDAMLAGPQPADLVQAFALPVPTMLICDVLGVPYSEAEHFQTLTEVFVNTASTPEQTVEAAEGLIALIDGLLDGKLAEPQDDLLSRLATEQLATEQMSREEVARIGLLLLTAGHESSANMIALGTAALLSNPEQMAALRAADSPKVAADAVEELLRYLTVVHSGARRVVKEDMEVGGELIRAGEGVVLAYDLGNRDPSAFDPDGESDVEELDITRPARHHLAFGYGVHQCLGQQLARVELAVVFETLAKRIPTLALAQPLEETPLKTDATIYGAHSLMVTW